MEYKDYFSLNEFDWEKEIRKDDEKVSAYISELPTYIDLPGEDAILMRTIRRRLGVEKDLQLEGEWELGPDGEEPDIVDLVSFNVDENWREAPGGAVYHNCSILARDLCLSAATAPNKELRLRVMRVLTLYGQLMARSADLIEMSLQMAHAVYDKEDPEIPENLRIAIVKRLLFYQNKLTNELRLLESEIPEMTPLLDVHLDASGMMHDYLISLLYSIRENKKASDDNLPF